jgi:hypothetical protein
VTGLLDLLRLVIAVTLLVAGASKLLSPFPLARGLGQVYGWAASRRRSATLVARAVAAVEVVAALLVATRWLEPAGYLLVGLVGCGIAGFAVTALTRGRSAECGCFGGSGGRPVGAGNVLAGLGLLAGAAVLVVTPSTAAADAAGGVLLGLTSASALAVVLVRRRSQLLRPFRHHFRSFSHPSFQQLREGAESRG